MDEFDVSSGLRIYPNPANETITILPEKNQRVNAVKLNDMLGRPVLEKTYSHWNGNKITIDIKDIPAGIYFIVIQLNNTYKTEPLIIE